MEIMSGSLYWPKKTKIQNIYPYLTQDVTCDVLVVGGGISGAITAYFLAKEGANVIVTEKNIVGYGQTLASTAIAEAQTEIDIVKLEKTIGTCYAKRVYKLAFNALDMLEEIISEIEMENNFKRKDLIYFTNRFMLKAQIQREFESRKKIGLDSLLIDSHDIIDMQSGIIMKNASATLNPYLFTQKVFEKLYDMPNVRIYENTNIEDINSRGDYNLALTSNKFKIKSDSVVLTSGLSSLKYIEKLPVEILKTYTIVTSQVEKFKGAHLNFTARDNIFPHHYMRFTDSGRLILGGEDIRINERFNDEKYATFVANDKYRRLKIYMDKTLNDFEDAHVEYAFNASICSSKDGLPIVDELPNMTNCFLNIGFGTNGIVSSIIGANMLKNAIKGFYSKDMNIFKIDR